MIHRLLIKNWQRHKALDLELGRVTTIVGPTNAGKSALLRALCWLAVGSLPGFVPKSGKMIRKGQKRVTVTVYVGKNKITRIKGDKNAYYVNGVKHAAFGTKIPDEVVKILNLGELNFQKQIGMPFWFAESPGQVSKNLNAIVDLSVIDDTMKNIGKMVGTTNAETEVVQDRVTTAKAERKDLTWVPEADNDLQLLEALAKVCKTQAIRARTLRELVGKATLARSKARQLKKALLAAPDIIEAGVDMQVAAQRRDELGSLLDKAKGLDTTTVPKPTALLQAYDEMEHAHSNVSNFQIMLEDARLLDLRVKLKHKEITKLLAKLKEYKLCPACGHALPAPEIRF